MLRLNRYAGLEIKFGSLVRFLLHSNNNHVYAIIKCMTYIVKMY